jgi:hypothetical protein
MAKAPKLTSRVNVKLDAAVKNQILNAVMKSKAFQAQADKKVAQKAAKSVSEHVEQYARAAVNEIAAHLQGVSGGESPLSQLKVNTPGGAALVKLPGPRGGGRSGWPQLSEVTMSRKGHEFFWFHEGRVQARYLAAMLNGYSRKKFTSYGTKLIRKPGRPEFDLSLSVELKKLPNPYDALVRRPFLSGAQGGELPEAPRFTGTTRRARQGVNRILWPENQRPLLRPIAYRMGRLTLQTFRKTLQI